MTAKLFILLGLILVVSSSACAAVGMNVIKGSGNMDEKEFDVSDFTGVSLSTFGNLYIELGAKEALRVEAEDNILKYIEVNVNGGVLKIKTRRGFNLRPGKSVNYYLTVYTLDSIQVSGSGDVFAPDLPARQFAVEISGSGDVDMDALNADSLDIRISGSGKLTIAGGEVARQTIRNSGSGKYRAEYLTSDQAEVRLSGSGSSEIQVNEHLQARISGSGSLYYLGSPTTDQRITGSGHVEKLGDQ